MAIGSGVRRDIINGAALEVPDDEPDRAAFIRLVDVLKQFVHAVIRDDIFVGVGERFGIEVARDTPNELESQILCPVTDSSEPVFDFNVFVVRFWQATSNVEAVEILLGSEEGAGHNGAELLGEDELGSELAAE